jgi:tetraacyldisaccharide 4'-kinase
VEAMRGRPGAAACALRVLLRAASGLYGAGVALRGAAWAAGLLRAREAARPVISVGNLTAGGTGKTPAVEYLAAALERMGRKPAVLCRGYGAKTPSGRSDEVEAIAGGVPVFADPDRDAAARRAAGAGADCLLLDDGFQHRALARDLDVLLVDALDPWGGGRLLPAGFLREPIRAARRAHAVILTRADAAGKNALDAAEARLRKAGAGAPVFHARHAPESLMGDVEGPAALLGGRRVFLLSGVGNPRGFRETARALGAETAGEAAFPDHHAYVERDLRDVGEEARSAGAEWVLTTTKDWVKVQHLPRPGLPVTALRIRFELLDRGEEFLALVRLALSRGDARAGRA